MRTAAGNVGTATLDHREEPHRPEEMHVLRDFAAVENIRDIWSNLQYHPNADIDFYLNAHRNNTSVLRPHVGILYRSGIPVAVLVGKVEVNRFHIGFGYLGLFKPRARVLSVSYGGLLGALSRENCECFVRHLQTALRTGEADVAMLRGLRPETPILSILLERAGILTRDYFPERQLHRATIMPSSWEQFLQALSAKERKKARQREKKISHDFPDCSVRCLSHSTQIPELIADVEQVAKKTYQRGLGVGFVDSSAMRARLQLAASKGWLRAYVLYLAGKPSAFWIGTLYQRTLHSDFLGYDPEHALYSPGVYLIFKAIELLYAEQCLEEIDWGLGDAQYKQSLGNKQWEDISVYLFAPTLKGFTLNALRLPAALADIAARKVLDRTNLLGRVKKLWRDRARAPHAGPGEN